MKTSARQKYERSSFGNVIRGLLTLQAAVVLGASALHATAGDVLVAGEEVYNANCANCHYDGAASETMPSLKDSPVVKGSAEALVRVILHGRENESRVNGKLIGGIMPPQSFLSDEEVAAVTTWLRAKFGGVEGVVSAAQIAQIRAEEKR